MVSVSDSGAVNPSVQFCLDLLRGCAADIGRPFREPASDVIARRLHPHDAAHIRDGFARGLLRIERGNYLRTLDPYQETAWLVEGKVASPCWEYLPHMAAYVELIDHFPPTSVRFEVPDLGLHLDLAVVTSDGQVSVLGEVKVLSSQLDGLVRTLPSFALGDPGQAPPKASGGPTGITRETWKLAHQLWITRTRLLWLVAAGDRRLYTVSYEPTLALNPVSALPVWPEAERPPTNHPRLRHHETAEESAGPELGTPPVS